MEIPMWLYSTCWILPIFNHWKPNVGHFAYSWCYLKVNISCFPITFTCYLIIYSKGMEPPLINTHESHDLSNMFNQSWVKSGLDFKYGFYFELTLLKCKLVKLCKAVEQDEEIPLFYRPCPNTSTVNHISPSTQNFTICVICQSSRLILRTGHWQM